MDNLIRDKKNVVIFGTGEIGRLAKYYIEHDPMYQNYNIVAFVTDDAYYDPNEPVIDGLPVVKSSEVVSQYPPSAYSAFVALSYNKLNKIREEKYLWMKSLGYSFISYISSNSVIAYDRVKVGENCFILENQTIQPDVTIGDNVMIWSSNHLGHGCLIRDHAYLASNICVSGHTSIGKRCFVGVSSAFKDFIIVGNDVFVTMGAMVTQDILNDSTVTSAGVFEKDHEANIKLKRKYFNVE